MFIDKSIKILGNFELRKGIVKNPILGAKMTIISILSIFAYTCKGWEVDPHQIFHHPENLR